LKVWGRDGGLPSVTLEKKARRALLLLELFAPAAVLVAEPCAGRVGKEKGARFPPRPFMTNARDAPERVQCTRLFPWMARTRSASDRGTKEYE
jgi:hypothetical protein